MRIQVCAVVVISLLVSACSGYGSSSNGTPSVQASQGTGGPVSNVPAVDLSAIKSSVAKAQTSISTAQASLSQLITSSGGFNFSALIGGVTFTGLSSCVTASFSANVVLFLPEDIANALTCVLNDVVSVAKAAKTDIANASAQLTVALAAAPAGSAEATEIQGLITEISAFQNNYVSMVTSLAKQLNIVTSALNGLSTLASGICPIPLVCGFAVNLLLQPIETAITTFQTQMETL